MRAALLQRQAALAGVALLAALGVVAIGGAGDGPAQPAGEQPPAATAPEWQEAQVAVLGPERIGQATACGITLAPETLGVAHAVLPCGVEVVLSANGREARAQVIEGGVGEGVAFDLTPALAQQLGVEGTATIRWRFAE